MTTLFYFLDLLFFVLLALSVGYLFVFALASKFGHPHRYPQTAMLHTFGIIFPAYKEDSVILSAVRSFLEQDYPADRYYIVVVSDQMQKSTNEALRTLPIRLLIANYPNSSKAKALAFAARTDEIRSSDAVIIMDADNTTSNCFLQEMNKAFAGGCQAVQAHRVAKNRNTDIALLDAVSEEINNSIFRRGHLSFGLSCALIGSGMALQTTWFVRHVNQLKTAGEDKELEALLLRDRIRIEYLEDLRVEDEKTQKKEVIGQQRKRWIAAQFGALRASLPDFPNALLTGNFSYADKIIQWMLPPRLILIGSVFLLTLLCTVFSTVMSLKWWILSLILILTMVLSTPAYLADKRLLKALLQLPSLVLLTLINLFKLKGMNKKFIHTSHGEHT